jgi:hypothetical protein
MPTAARYLALTLFFADRSVNRQAFGNARCVVDIVDAEHCVQPRISALNIAVRSRCDKTYVRKPHDRHAH